ncbi:MAG: radical SAM protein [Deltaproteobacteria bacterium]|jgi:nitrogenase molybdenum-iron protein alpha/beta subunit/MoaA/NifB/PqqE/SkfB family radical SAM enzyme|nr:radical SAM protein [Deltaproteobacteria bacterium]
MPDCLVNVAENPCRMCLPLGAVTAFYGLEGAMSLLHGSQGCSTYIRRHMATHYNEPVDIASSSLTEEGTVFGGERNLVKGLDNLIRLYRPKLVAVSTTCLAETIGEDVRAMIRRYKADRPGLETELVAVPAPGYGGTHFEGWFRGLAAALDQLPLKKDPNPCVNVIPGPSSPADVRALKGVLEESGLGFILFPDISENLDGPYDPVYSRLPSGGTPLSLVSLMAGARATIELSLFAPPQDSPGLLLKERYGVPLVRLAPPVGLRGADGLLAALRELGGTPPARLAKSRGRLMDAMCDSHKYSALGRAAFCGDPDFVHSMARLAAENGLPAVLAATGSKADGFAEAVLPEVRESLATQLIPEGFVSDRADFARIEAEAEALGVNLMAASSDARRMCSRLGIPLVRACFPVHDHVGGQRIRTFGYEGSLALLDRMVNELVTREEEGFRSRIKGEFLAGGAKAAAASAGLAVAAALPPAGAPGGIGPAGPPASAALSGPAPSLAGAADRSLPGPAPAPRGPGAPPNCLPLELSGHPCFSLEASHACARLHLPVAPGCNISCNYCRRDRDCPNEGRPGAASRVLTPEEALERFREVRAARDDLRVVGIAGPGEPLHSPEAALRTFALVRREDPGIQLCLSTNGLMLPLHLRELFDLGLRHLTVTVNAVDPSVGAAVCSHVDYHGGRYFGEAGASLLLAGQLGGIALARSLGIRVKVNTVLLKGVNVAHVQEIARKVASLGAEIGNLMEHYPVPGSVFERLPETSAEERGELRRRCAAHLSQMTHCRRCRADAAGLLGGDFREGAAPVGEAAAASAPEAPAEAEAGLPVYRIAVVTKSAVVVDSHFAQADRFYIYESDGRDLRLVENRKAGGSPGVCGGGCGARGGAGRPEGFMSGLVNALSDCHAVVASRVGDSPKRLFAEKGILAMSSLETVDKAVLAAARAVGGENASQATGQ